MNQTKQDGITIVHVLVALQSDIANMKQEHRQMLWEAARAWEKSNWLIVRQKVGALRKAGALMQKDQYNRRLAVLTEAVNRIYKEAKQHTPNY